MPNHIKNRIQIIGDPDLVKKVIDSITTHHKKREHYSFDGGRTYTKYIDDDNVEYGWLDEKTNIFKRREGEPVEGVPEGYVPYFDDAWDQLPDFGKIVKPPLDDPAYNDEPSQSEVDHLPNWWGNWNRENWGVKWNSYCCQKVSEDIFTFETPWSGVPDLIEKLGQKFPDVEIKYEWSSEDIGYNCGIMSMSDGVSQIRSLEGGSRESYELAFQLRPDYKSNYKLKDDNYVYNDDE